MLKQNKELAWLPVFSTIASLFAIVIMGVLFFYIIMRGNINAFDNMQANGVTDALSYVILLIYYLVMFFITNYFLTIIYIIVHGRFGGQDLSLKNGVDGANKNLGKIFLWSLISATVGVILQIIADRSKFAGKVVTWIFGAAWSILTYFSLPSIIIGQKQVKESFQESAAVIRRTWGETIIINFGVGLYFGLLVFIGIALAIGIIILAPIKIVFITIGILFVIFLIVIAIVSSTLGSIFKLALYEYALTGNAPQGFTPDIIKGAINAGK